MPQRSMRNAMRSLSGLDLYAHPVGVNYRGSETYGTILGSVCSLLTLVLVCINAAKLIGSFADHSDQSEFY